MGRRVLLAYERDLEEIGVDPADAASLEVLDLNRNPRLGTLPPLLALARLRFLYAEDTGIAAVPALPPSLEYLNVAANRLTAPPADDLPRLRELRLGGNPIAELAGDAFAGMPALRLLSLRGCALEHLPATVDGLRELRDLDLRANRLTDVPAWLGDLPALARVDLRWNPLDAVPPELERLAAHGGVLWHPAGDPS
jgi:Leucine-rich repeat (LRR) protein